MTARTGSRVPGRPLRLLIVTFDPPENVGGVEGRASAYVRELASAGNYVEVVALAPGYTFSAERFQGANLLRFPSSWRETPRAFRSAVAEINARSINSVFLLSGALTLFGAVLLSYARLTGRRSLAFVYGKDLLGARVSPLQRLLFLASGLLTRRLAVNSRFTSGLLPGFLSGKVGILYPGVDPELARYAPVGESAGHGRKVVLFVGRLVERKGADDLIAAFASLKGVDAELELAGDGPDRARLERIAERLGVGGRVTFLGTLRGSALYERYARCDLLVLPSRSSGSDVEGFGTVFLEAAVFGKPSIGTRSGGIPEAIVDGETGLLVAERDVEALASAMKRLLLDDEERLRMGERARARALAAFTWARSAESLVRLLQ